MHPYITWAVAREQQRDARSRARAAARAQRPSAVPPAPLPSALRRSAASTLRAMADQLEPGC